MSMYLPGTLIAVSKEHLQDIDKIFTPMFLMEGMQLRQVTQLLGIEAHTVQNWVKRGFVDSPVKKQYNRERFVRLAILNYFKDVFSLEGILRLYNPCGYSGASEGPVGVPEEDERVSEA